VLRASLPDRPKQSASGAALKEDYLDFTKQ
jgi:hypothetical protein